VRGGGDSASGSGTRVRIRVDEQDYDVPGGSMLLEALDQIGVLMREVEIPHYCWHPKLSVDGSCRLCQVEIEGRPGLQIACGTPVEDGMVVRTRTDTVREAREGVMELLLVNHPLDCPICDQAGECELQEYAVAYGSPSSRSREPRRTLQKRMPLGPTMLLDQERCILCRRCVRFCREVTGGGELAVFGRGDRSVIDMFPGTQLEDPYSMNLADVCPVGALTTRDFRFKVRVWDLETTETVCGHCARGCNVYMDVAKGEVARLRPRRNDAVNDTWMCDAGRLSYAGFNTPDRLSSAFLRGEEDTLEPSSLDTAIDVAAARLRALIEARGPGVVGCVASARSTNEDLFVLRRLADGLEIENAGVSVPRGESDELLRHPEAVPNAAGARALGFGDARDIVERLRGGGLHGLLVFGSDFAGAELGGEVELLSGLDTVILVDTHQSELQRLAHVMLPVRHLVEREGTLTNCDGRVQQVHRVLDPKQGLLEEGALIARLGAALGLDGFDGSFDALETSRALAEAQPRFAGAAMDAVPGHGLLLDRAGEEA
jgi:NADH-quinone oxidoreductase subunit G